MDYADIVYCMSLLAKEWGKAGEILWIPDKEVSDLFPKGAEMEEFKKARAYQLAYLHPMEITGWMTKEDIEDYLKMSLGAEKVLWLPRGIYNDETTEHVDNVCAFTGPAEVVLAWTDDESDPQYAMSKACLDVLEKETDANGRYFTVHKLPIPKNPVCITAEELEGYEFEEGEDVREVGERLAASYVNFYISNGHVVVPQFGDENDKKAVEILQGLFPTRSVAGVYARDILIGGGNIHCITQQIPASDRFRTGG